MTDIKVNISVITSLYRSITYLEPFFQNFLEISNLDKTELVIVHNDPTPEESKIVEKYSGKIPHFIYHVVPREGLYTSWNRGIQLSNGKYLAMWNVDDRRAPDSLEKQAEVLDDDEGCMMVSGNYYKVFNYGDHTGYLKKDPVRKSIFNKAPKFNNGCFLMWRKTVHESIGFFDEQFKIKGDFEFWCRVTSGFKAKSCDSVLGYFLRISNEGLSKKKKNKRDIENEIIRLRYYNFFLANIYLLLVEKSIRLTEIINFNKFIKIKTNRKRLLITALPSLFLFWFPNIVSHLVNIRYKLLATWHNKKHNCEPESRLLRSTTVN